MIFRPEQSVLPYEIEFRHIHHYNEASPEIRPFRPVILKTEEILGTEHKKCTGILNLRADRGDRTLQWIENLKESRFDKFEKIYAVGAHSKILKRKVNQKIIRIVKKSPEYIMNMIINNSEDNEIIFGFGNMKGMGESLIDHWKNIGEDYGV